jgi:ferrous iron transport protein B
VGLKVSEDQDEESLQTSLISAMQSAVNDSGAPLFTLASAIGLILFFMIALQCMATFGVARREFGNWRAPIAQLVAFNVVAYVLAVAAVQTLRAFGIS